MKRLVPVLTAAVVAASTGVAWSQEVRPDVLKNAKFKIPNPQTVEHPGADAAPASSPRTYPLEAGFHKRVDILVAGLATNDLSNWRKGYFAGGDPGKYTHGPIMAKLLLDPQAKDAVEMQNDNRSPKEQYHFAAVNWARSLPLFGDVLNDPTKTLLDQSIGKYGYLGQGGTENHKTMWITAANVLPYYTKSGRLHNMGRDQALARAKDALREYVHGLLQAGNGEWDSSTYMMFTMNGMMNIYDFAKDEDQRLLAKAALDWQATAYALKYTDGVFNAPHQRGYSEGPVSTIADRTGWLWWGSKAQVTPEQMRGSNYAMHAATSSWRPNKVITNIATRELPDLPFEVRSSKPNYWGIAGTPKPGTWLETTYVTKHYTMASLWRGFGGQATRFQITATTDKGPLTFNGASPLGRNDGDGSLQLGKFGDGNGMYDQSAQIGSTYIVISNIADDDGIREFAEKWAMSRPAQADKASGWVEAAQANQFAFFKFDNSLKPQTKDGWHAFQAGNTYIAVRGLTGQGELATTPQDRRGNSDPIIRFDGLKTGFVVETGDVTKYKSLADFTAALAKAKLDAKLQDVPSVNYTSIDGRQITVTYNKEARNADVTVDGKAIDFGNWPTYDSPYVKQSPGVFTVNDGKDGFTIDFTGEKPVYKPWKK